ncbi:MAG: YaiI/YqxD family protein [Candidatus Marinimicrobia bacterium]|nr:YaiI/YqxD family protein [Candidatus Neomarinimicrobiota bacterium]MBT3631888.1 YaiI/YqxD family protein [Candidatus Neomarinimicrobiota bacterium]MBT3824447.1 YaiI/YqxD family protein [Candidatus Neomarinimicrobiota bacterium]MBT4131127.1 YaiI/YqxD family protein [Candidatus Neomarinimicrobiota bacterium]MBT4296737.1 YaiI/YqxD family protein [Candidatus Neomarinimicrobiota bacterium]
MLHIYVDADACPVKNEVYRVADRYGLEVTLVSNSRMRIPQSSRVKLEVVGDGFDEADDWIVDHVQASDVVITADIPLAGRCISAGAEVLGPPGKRFTDDNIGQTLATRDLLAELRGAGEITGGPPPLTQRDRSEFLQKLDVVVQSIRRR